MPGISHFSAASLQPGRHVELPTRRALWWAMIHRNRHWGFVPGSGLRTALLLHALFVSGHLLSQTQQGHHFMSRSPMTAILPRSKRARRVLSLVLLAVFDQVDEHFLLLKHFLLWLPCCFLLWVFLFPHILFSLACFYRITC